MRNRTTFLATILAIASTAHGQTGSIVPSMSPLSAPEGRSTGDPARVVFDAFTLCVVKYHHKQVVKALQPPASMADDNKTLPALMDGECITGKNSAVRSYGGLDIGLTTNPITFRGTLYKALVRQDFARHLPGFGPAPVAMAGYNSRILGFADCVVRHDREDSLKLIEAIPGSGAEQAALDALGPQLGGCSSQGAKLRLSKGNFVGFLAEAYYREADASKSTGTH